MTSLRPEPTEGPAEVSVEDAHFALQAGARLVDVREPAEYVAGHVPGAQLIPLGEIVARSSELLGTGTVYVICAVGGRSYAAAGALLQSGVEAVSIAGGTNLWAETGRPIQQGMEPGSLD